MTKRAAILPLVAIAMALPAPVFAYKVFVSN